MKHFLIIVFITLTTQGYSQFFPVDTAKLNNTYRIFAAHPRNYENQKAFLDAFPSTFNEFSYTYGYFSEKKGYNLTMYYLAEHHIIDGLAKLDLIPDSVYCKKLIWLCLEGRWDADAPSYLQSLLRVTMKNKRDVMFKLMNSMVEGQQVSLCFFYFHDRFKTKKAEFEELRNAMGNQYPQVVHSMEIAYPASAGMVWY